MMAIDDWRPFSRQLLQVMKCAVDDWFLHRASSKGAALAFYTAFSMAPILVLVIAIAGFFWGAEAAQGQLLAELKGLVGAQGAEAIQLVLKGAQDKETGAWATIVCGEASPLRFCTMATASPTVTTPFLSRSRPAFCS